MAQREIKFRARDDGRMIYPTGAMAKISRFFRVIREDAILMQFTGRHDKSNNEIYEGDIVNGIDWPTREGDCKNAVVEFRRGCFTENYYGREISNYEIEILGNIYENPELLK